MSWSRPLCAALALTGLLALPGCGFRPLYGEASSSRQMRQILANVDVAPIRDRLGQMVRNEIIAQLPAGDAPGPHYQLIVEIDQEDESQTIRKDATATRTQLIQTSRFQLRNDKGAVAFSGKAVSVASYDILSQRYATVAAERDAEERAARKTAEQIVGQLAAHFAADDGKTAP